MTPQEIKELMGNPDSVIFSESDFKCDGNVKINVSFLDDTEKDLTVQSVQIPVNDDQLKIDTAR